MTDRSKLLLRLAVVAALAGSAAGCDTLSNMNPFGEKKTPLAGERRPVPQVAPNPPDTVPQPLSALPLTPVASLA
ncbi:hypothetical protein [Methylopila sp. 73B]|uniref:hypothetical protein n=1 Tax=Methylopila sp. 73B TaxID=1120792 RepID=UPI0003750657|nr:hypothetical protein [Methylopila sp. 73B]